MRRHGLGPSGSLTDSVRASVLPYLVSRAIVLAALGVARFLSDTIHHASPAMKGHLPSYVGLLGWDASWYVRIAEMGYAGAGPSSLRFFPLFPLMIRYLGALPGVSYDAASLIIVNVAAFVALVALHALVTRESLGEGVATRAVWILSLWPAAFVLVMGYSEALLLCLSIAAFWCWRNGRYWWAVVPAYLAALSRPVGLLLAVPALVEILSEHRSRQLRMKDVPPRLCSLLAAPAGAATFLGWSAATTGSFTKPMRLQVQSSHRGGVADPLVTVEHEFHDLFNGVHLGSSLHAPFVVVFVVLTIYLFFRLPAAYGWYAAATMAVAVTAPNLDSFERYGLACFPLAIAAACLTENRSAERVVLAGLGATLACLATLAFLSLYVP